MSAGGRWPGPARLKTGASLAWLVACLLLVLVAVMVALNTWLHRALPAALSGAALAVLFAFVFRGRLRRDVERVNDLIAALPLLDPAARRPATANFTLTAHAIDAASQRMQTRLYAAGNERKQLEAVLDSMQDAVVAVDAGGKIQWTNQRMQRLLPGSGSASSRVGTALVQMIRDPEVLECVRLAAAEQAVPEQAMPDHPGTVRRSTSLVPGRIFEVNASPMPGGGAVAVLHDVTRIEEVERTQKDFIANVSHELRTPLTSITGYVETLLDHETLSPQAREFLETILKNATRMNRLTEDLLVMARVERPAAEMNPMPIPADLLIHDAVKAVSGLIQESEATLELSTITECQVFADHDSVMQVLGNLIENAIKYGRSRVVVSSREVAEPYDAVEFSVRDFGPGIASEHLSRIFERFYRVDKTRSRESGGTGLGLSIARHVVQMQGGAIWAESTLGAGSTFLFTLPKAIYPVARQERLATW